jgi:hypothetical protein
MLSPRRHVFSLFFTLAIGYAVSLAPLGANAATDETYGVNLVVNGDAEAELGAPDNDKIVKPSGWTTTGEFTAVQYGASGGFPDKTSPGPATRGKSLFEGGNVAKSTATQQISLAAYGTTIDAGAVKYALSAWLGGFASQGDNASVTVAFTDAAGTKLGSATLPAVTAPMRKSVTGSVAENAAGAIPKGTRAAIVTVVLTRVDGKYNDGSADDISLVLTKTP